ncbi:hypothetical protein K501DRAFT_214975 [Backusella circina FSU 941]|nr:hypothetical protein K501DRAFT_214975 [Backusella circina FSU 941]
MASSSFRSSKWDPILILAQITALQSVCYIVYSIVLYIALILTGTDVSLDLIFSAVEIRTDTTFGWSLIIVWLVNAFLTIPILMFIVQRARQILDFVLTFHFFHVLIGWRITHVFPTSGAWWTLQFVNCLIMTFGGEWACMHREMKPIMITSGNKKSSTKQQDTMTNNGESSSSNNSGFPIEGDDEDELLAGEQNEGGYNKKKGKSKRKSSDAEVKELSKEDHAPMLAAVEKAKKAILSSSRTKRNSKKYDIIPMKDIDDSNV